MGTEKSSADRVAALFEEKAAAAMDALNLAYPPSTVEELERYCSAVKDHQMEAYQFLVRMISGDASLAREIAEESDRKHLEGVNATAAKNLGRLRVVKPPAPVQTAGRGSVFLAGTIEMGMSHDWQLDVERELSDMELTVFNPRRDDWDSSWQQVADNPNFRRQVEWELEALEASDLILFHFAAGTKSPVTFMELGLHASSGKCIVHCEEGFWRKGNIDIVCDRYDVRMASSLGGLVEAVRREFA